MRFSKIVLPDPDGPSTTTNAASSTCKLTSSTALTTVSPPPNQRHTPSRSIRVPAAPARASTAGRRSWPDSRPGPVVIPILTAFRPDACDRRAQGPAVADQRPPLRHRSPRFREVAGLHELAIDHKPAFAGRPGLAQVGVPPAAAAGC